MAEAAKKPKGQPVDKKKAASKKKSGLRQLKTGEIIFNEGDAANSLFIIQKGQLRLFKPKGQGFIELAVLRAGEVLGEMAYFDDDGRGDSNRRSCSAMALTHTEVIEISFNAFGKTIESLNPWFKTIINTLASRLRKTNARVKQLESNQMSVNYGTGGKDYQFIRELDTIKILSTIFLVFKSHGEKTEQGTVVNKKTLDLYQRDIYGNMEAKVEMVLQVLEDLKYIETMYDKDELPSLYKINKLTGLKDILFFLNTQRFTEESKKISISSRCEMVLDKMYPIISKAAGDEQTGELDVTPIFDDFKSRNIMVGVESLNDAKAAGIILDVIVKDGGGLTVELDVRKLKDLYPKIKFVNSLAAQSRKQSGDI